MSSHDAQAIREELDRIARADAYADGLPDEIAREVKGSSFDDLVEFILPNARQQLPPGISEQRALAILGQFWQLSQRFETMRFYQWYDKASGERRDNIAFPASFDLQPPLRGIRLSRNMKPGKPWVVVFIGDLETEKAVHPSQEIERFAWLGPWEAFLRELADAALPEQWDFSVPNPDRPYEILKSYISTTFIACSKKARSALTKAKDSRPSTPAL